MPLALTTAVPAAPLPPPPMNAIIPVALPPTPVTTFDCKSTLTPVVKLE